MDNIDAIVDKAIQYTEDILARAPRHYAVAREGLERMRDNLQLSAELGAEDHQALQKLENYLNDLGRRFAN